MKDKITYQDVVDAEREGDMKMSKDKGHNYFFPVPEVPWQREYHGEEVRKHFFESKPYLEQVRQFLLHIMSNRHNPKDVWECASEAVRLIDTEGQDG